MCDPSSSANTAEALLGTTDPGLPEPRKADLRKESADAAVADGHPATPLSLSPAANSATCPSRLHHAHHHAHHAASATAELASITSNAVPPGSASPLLEQARSQYFVPPTRPSSTPFPQPEHRTDDLRCLGCAMDCGEEADSRGDGDDDGDENTAGGSDGTGDGFGLGGSCGRGHAAKYGFAYPANGDVNLQDATQLTSMDLDLDLDLEDLDGMECDNGGFANEDDFAYDASHGTGDFTTPPPDTTLNTLETTSLSTISFFSNSSPPADDFVCGVNVESPVDPLYQAHNNSCDMALDSAACTAVAAASSATLKLITAGAPASPPNKAQRIFLHHLPTEIQELILDHAFDCRVSPMTRSSPDKRLTRLACISRIWRVLIQERLYCYIKLKATTATLNSAMIHFAQSPHLRSYVKHVELWFPVFQPKTHAPAAPPPSASSSLLVPLASASASAPTYSLLTVLPDGMTTSATYTLPSDNCSLEEVFHFASTAFPELAILTLEGGERKKAPQVRHFVHGGNSLISEDGVLPPAIPQIKTVHTLFCKGQWNLLRNLDDFYNVTAALPNLSEWHASYSKPKSKSYLTMATILPQLPTNLTTLDLCLEGDYRQELTFPPHFIKVSRKLHFCTSLAKATPALQHLSYTGRVCRTFFDVAACLADPRSTRLKSVALTVKNCCRHVNHWQESGSGTADLNFIRAFEALVLSAVRSMAHLTKLENLRIRYVDLEFPVPPLNPFFVLRDGMASGVWSDTIVAELNRVRPDSRWEDLSDHFDELVIGKDGRMFVNPDFPKKRIASLKLSSYANLAAPAAI